MAGNEFIFIEVQLHYKYYFKRKGYIDSPVWIKNKKATINKKNDDVKCLQYAATVQLNHSAIEYNPERVSNIESFISKYNWHGINYPSKWDNWKKIEKNNPVIALNIMYVKNRKKFFKPIFQITIQLTNKFFF